MNPDATARPEERSTLVVFVDCRVSVSVPLGSVLYDCGGAAHTGPDSLLESARVPRLVVAGLSAGEVLVRDLYLDRFVGDDLSDEEQFAPKVSG